MTRLDLDGGADLPIMSPGFAPVALAAAASGGLAAVLVLADGGVGGELLDYASIPSTPSGLGDQANPFDVTAVGTEIYWTESSAGRIDSVAEGLSGGATSVQGEDDCQSIAADALGFYWTRPSFGMVSAQLTAAQGVVMVAQNEQSPTSLVADGTNVYWLTAGTGGNGGLLRRWDHSSPTASTIATDFDAAFANPHVHGIALTNEYIVWITNAGQVMRLHK